MKSKDDTNATSEDGPVGAETASPVAPVTKQADLALPWGRFEDWFEQWPQMFSRRWPEMFERTQDMAMIKVEQATEEGNLVIRAELPGIDPATDIDVSVRDGQVTISAKREQREETKTDGSFRSEFRYGSFQRTLPVPGGTTAEDVKASYEDGILTVRIPIDQTNETLHKVPIERKG